MLRRITLASIALICAASIAAAADPLQLRRLIGAGDEIPGLARVGTNGFDLLGADDSGRALLQRVGAAGAPALYWADEHGIAAALDPTALGDLRLIAGSAAWNRRGDLAVLASRDTATWARFGSAIIVVDHAGLHSVAAAGDLDQDGDPLCRIDAARINDAGQVAFLARVATGGRACSSLDGNGNSRNEPTIYLAGAPPTRLASADELKPAGAADAPLLALVALRDDGAVVASSGGRILRLTPAGSDEVVGPATQGPSGAPLAPASVMAASAGGEVSFQSAENDVAGLYRTTADTIVRVFAAGDLPPAGVYDRLALLDTWSAIDDAGDVLYGFDARALAFAADGSAARVLPGVARSGALNDTGDIVVDQLTGESVSAVARWRDGQAAYLARSGDVLPSGEVMADGGFEPLRLAADGRSAVSVSTVDGFGALVCTDGDGAHVVARVGDPAPGGRRFYEFRQGAFSAGDALAFTATILEPDTEDTNPQYTYYSVVPSIYRARADVMERVIGRGDVTTDGAVVYDLLAGQGDFGTPAVLDADADGRVLTLATLDDHYGATAILVREADGTLRSLPLTLDNTGGSWSGIGFPNVSVVDHLFLSGETDTPAQPPLRASRTAETTPTAGTPTSYRLEQARLFGDGVFVLGSRRRFNVGGYDDVPVALVWTPALGVREVLSGDQDDFGPFSTTVLFGAPLVSGNRVLFPTYRLFPDRLYSYTLGDERAHQVPLPTPGPSSPYSTFNFLTAETDGRLLLETSNDPETIATWDGTTLTSALTLDEFHWPSAVDHALFVNGYDSLQVLAPPLTPGPQCPQPPTIVAPTRTITPTVSATPTTSATRSATPSRSASPTVTATPACLDGSACLLVGSSDAAAGADAFLTVAFNGGADVVATQNDLALPPLAALESCSAGAGVDKQVGFRQHDSSARVVVLSLGDLAPIGAQAVLYRCALRLAADAPPGRYPIGCGNANASDRRGAEIAIGCMAGELRVAAAASATPSPATPTTTMPAATASPTPTATAPLATTTPSATAAAATATPANSDNQTVGASEANDGSMMGCAVVAPGPRCADLLPLFGAGPFWALARRRRRRRPA